MIQIKTDLANLDQFSRSPAQPVLETGDPDAALRAVERQLTLIADASSALLASPHASEVLRTIVELAQRFGSADAHAVWRMRSEDGVWTLASSAGLSEEYIQTGSGRYPDSAMPPPNPIAFEDISKEPQLANRREALSREGVKSMLAIPLQLHGAPTSSLVFYWKTLHRITESEIRIASALGNLAATALATAELYDRELALRAEAQASEHRAAFLAEAGAVLASSLDYETTLRSVAKLAIPTFADWSAVDLYVGGRLERVTVEHADPAKVQFAHEYREKYPSREDDPSQVAFRTGQPILIEHIPDELLVERIPDPEQLRMVRAMGLESFMIVPMVNRGRALGLLTFVSSKPGRRYAQADLDLAQELARRAATAIDNARLYADVRASEERYRSLVSATTSIVWTVNPAGEFIEPQLSWQAFTGQTWEEHRGFGWASAIHPDDVERAKAEWDRARDAQAIFRSEGRLWHAATGQYRYYVSRAVPVRNPDGSIAEWIGTVTDIHERKHAEEERNALLLREQQARYIAQLLNRVGPTLSAQLDPQMLSESITDLATKLIGAEVGALFRNVANEDGEASTLYTVSGAPYEAFANVPIPRSTAVFGPAFRGDSAVRSDDITQDSRYSENAPFRAMPEGHLPVRSYLAVPLVSRSGEVLGGLFFGHSKAAVFQQQAVELATGIASQAAIALDNARLFAGSQRAQDALWRSNEDLRRANEDLNHFAYSASHDLQEPLRMVSAYTQLLKRKYQGKLDSQADDYIRYAVQGAQRMEFLVRDILVYTQAANMTRENVRPVDANVVIEKVLSNLQTLVADRSAVVTHGELPTVHMHEIHLTQLFQNLIGNAIKYGGESAPIVDVQAVRNERAWLFSVQDNGIGIDPKYREQVFGLFRRLHSSAEYAGTGIGLAICRKIVDRYGGSIWVDSSLGHGATFYFALPDPSAEAA